MNVICSRYETCPSETCSHKKSHEHYDSCDRDCDRYNVSKCIVSLSIIRKEKLKKLYESNL